MTATERREGSERSTSLIRSATAVGWVYGGAEKCRHDVAARVGGGRRGVGRLCERHRDGRAAERLGHEAVVPVDIAAVPPGRDPARQRHLLQPEPVVEQAVAAGHRNGLHHLVQQRPRHDPAVEERGDERRGVLVGGDQRACCACGGRIEVGDVGATAVDQLVAVREDGTQAVIAGRREVGVEQTQRHDDAPGDLVGGRPPSHLPDQKSQNDVVGVRVLHRRAGRELRRPRQRHVEELLAGGRIVRRRGLGVEVLRQAALVAHQLSHRDRVRVDALAADAARQVRLDGGVEVDPPLGDQLHNRRSHKGFRHAGRPDVGIGGEPGPGLDIGETGRRAGEISAIAHHGDATGEVAVDDDAGQRGVDRGGLGVSGRGCQTQ